MRQRNYKDTYEQSTPQINNSKPTKTNSTPHKKIIFKDVVDLLPHSSFRILSHQISFDSTSNGYNSTIRQGTNNRTLIRCRVNLYILKKNNNAIAVVKAFNTLVKLIHDIEGDVNKIKIAPWKSKQPNLEVLRYIKGEKYPEAEVGKYIYAIRAV